MTLSDDIKNDMASEFLDSNEFAEPVVFCPGGCGGTTIKAIVNRGPKLPTPEDNNKSLSNETDIQIANTTDTTKGRSVINVGKDQVKFPAILGGSDNTWTVVDILDHDNGCWHLRVVR